jgi:hypothetical protein
LQKDDEINSANFSLPPLNSATYGRKQRYATKKSEMINGLQDSRREDEPLNMQENG